MGQRLELITALRKPCSVAGAKPPAHGREGMPFALEAPPHGDAQPGPQRLERRLRAEHDEPRMAREESALDAIEVRAGRAEAAAHGSFTAQAVLVEPLLMLCNDKSRIAQAGPERLM